MQNAPHEETQDALSAVFREEAGRLVGALVRILGNFEVAEEVVQDALLAALERWPIEGIPARPGAWLMTVARHRALDQLRRDARYRDKLAALEQPITQELQPANMATSIHFDGNGKPLVTDGPYLEGTEVIGGYAEIEVADLDEALSLAKTWPGGGVEIRPVIPH